MECVFELLRIGEEKLALNNKATGAIWLISYRKATLYDKVNTAGGRYVTESDWSGSAEELFSRLIPRLQAIRTYLNPKEEFFASTPACSEYSHGNSTYYDEYQSSGYSCRFINAAGIKVTARFKFKKWEFTSVDSSEEMGREEKDALKQEIQSCLESVVLLKIRYAPD